MSKKHDSWQDDDEGGMAGAMILLFMLGLALGSVFILPTFVGG